MNFISRWLEKRRKAVDVMVLDVMREEAPSGSRCIDEGKIVQGVRFSSWPDELEHKPYFIRAFEVRSALERLVKRGVLKRSERHFVSPTESISTNTFALRA